MSTPFTSPYSEATLQDLLDEIVLAYSERRQAIGQTAYTPADDRDVQAVAYWTAIQNWIETNCTAFVDHVNGPFSGHSSLKFTLATFRAAAGLHPDGFHRATVWDGTASPEYSYGLLQAGDIIGPWVIEDVQKAFSALRWSKENADFISDLPGTGTVRVSGYSTMDDAKEAAWDAYINLPTPAPSDDFKYIYGFTEVGGVIVETEPIVVEYYAEIGVVVEQPIDLTFTHSIPYHSKELMAYVHKVYHFNSLGSTLVEGWNILTPGINYPDNISPIWAPPALLGHHGFISRTAYGMGHDPSTHWLIKWNFTNCNEV